MSLRLVGAACAVVAVVLILVQGQVSVVLGSTHANLTCASVWQAWTKATYEVFGGAARHRCQVQRRDHFSAAIVLLIVGFVLIGVAGFGAARVQQEKRTR